ncbi:alpha-dioxygenase PIOX-like [Fagus crenata]
MGIKLKISSDGLLLPDQDGIALSGDTRNGWIGVSTLQALFIKEHDAICDTLKREYRQLEEEELYRHARLVTYAIIAKVHTIDWTMELLKTDIFKFQDEMLLWFWKFHFKYGLLGKELKDTFGHVGGAILGGLVGLEKPNNHDVAYLFTEEFVNVYRMVPMPNLIGHKGEKALAEIGLEKLMVSMGHQACGALKLWNYPNDRPDHVDLPALEVYRDRERKVARYNEFRRALLLIPISKWEDLTDDNEVVQALDEMYGDDVEDLDLLVGLMAETKIKGFAINETVFVIFLIMATKADRFFTSNFNEKTYTRKGLAWVNSTENLKDILDRHYPEMVKKWINSTSAFSVWDSPPNSHNPIPLYLRVPK